MLGASAPAWQCPVTSWPPNLSPPRCMDNQKLLLPFWWAAPEPRNPLWVCCVPESWIPSPGALLLAAGCLHVLDPSVPTSPGKQDPGQQVPHGTCQPCTAGEGGTAMEWSQCPWCLWCPGLCSQADKGLLVPGLCQWCRHHPHPHCRCQRWHMTEGPPPLSPQTL